MDVLVAILSIILRIPLAPYWLRLNALLNTHDCTAAASGALLAASLLLPAALLLACPTHPGLTLCTLIYSVSKAALKRQGIEDSLRRTRFDCAAAA